MMSYRTDVVFGTSSEGVYVINIILHYMQETSSHCTWSIICTIESFTFSELAFISINYAINVKFLLTLDKSFILIDSIGCTVSISVDALF